MDGCRQILVHGTTFVDGRAQHVHDATQRRLAHRHGDGVAGIGHHDAAAQAVGRTQRNSTHHAIAQLLLNFQRQCGAIELQRVIDLRHLVARKLHVHHGADTLNNFSLGLSHFLLQLV